MTDFLEISKCLWSFWSYGVKQEEENIEKQEQTWTQQKRVHFCDKKSKINDSTLNAAD